MGHEMVLVGPEIKALPYIEVPTSKGVIKMLIDCGANVNVISKKWAFSSGTTIYPIREQNVRGVTGSEKIENCVKLNIFQPLVQRNFKFLVLDFHPFFDGIIGTEILFGKRFNLITAQKALEVKCDSGKLKIIPLKFYNPTPAPRGSINKAETINILEKIRISHLNEKERNSLIPIIRNTKEVFHNPDNKLTCTTNVECEIRTTDDIPIYQKSYPYPIAYKSEVEKQIQKLLSDGIIRPSRSAWNSPVWIVPKKADASGEKKFQLVIDYRKVNDKTISDKYPMPEISNTIDQLGGNKYFTTLDLSSGFHQIRMKEEDIEKTAFSVNYGKYEFLRMPFGLKNAPAIFQRSIDDVLRQHIGKRCYVYIDDVIVVGKTLEEHLENLEIVLKTLNEANLKVQLDKSEFLHNSVEFLGYIITDEGIKPNEKKIEVIRKYPEPKNLKQLRGFLGMIGYYRRFVKDFAKIAKPLTKLLRGEGDSKSVRSINLNLDEKMCFETMKQILTSNDILTYPDFSKPFCLTTDASDYAIGAVLSQGNPGNDRPIHFASRTLNKTEESYSATEKELLAIVWALKAFRGYLYGQKVKIFTDHQPLTYNLSPKTSNRKLMNWRNFIEEHDYEITYKPGKSNVVADALSRVQINSLTPTQHSAEDDDSNYIISTEAPLNGFRSQIIIETTTTNPETIITNPFPGYRRILIRRTRFNEQILTSILKEFCDPTKTNGLHTSEEILGQLQEVFKKYFSRPGLLKIRFTQTILRDVTDSDEQEKIVRETHDRAHRGIQENKYQILREFYFPKITQHLKKHIRVCDNCNTSKYDRRPLIIPIQETPIPNYPYQILHLDIFQIESDYYLSSIDKFSKYGRMIPIRSRHAVHISKAIWETVTSFIIPNSLVMDNERAFQSPDIKGKLLDLNIRVYLTPNSKSEVNGCVERFHSTIIELFRIQKQITPHLPSRNIVHIAVEKYNNTIHSSTLKTPKEILFGNQRDPERQIDPDRLEQIRQKTYDEVIIRLKEAQYKLLEKANKNRQPAPALETGQMVYVKDKIIKPKHKEIFNKAFVQNSNEVTFRNEGNSKLHKSNVKNINLFPGSRQS